MQSPRGPRSQGKGHACGASNRSFKKMPVGWQDQDGRAVEGGVPMAEEVGGDRRRGDNGSEDAREGARHSEPVSRGGEEEGQRTHHPGDVDLVIIGDGMDNPDTGRESQQRPRHQRSHYREMLGHGHQGDEGGSATRQHKEKSVGGAAATRGSLAGAPPATLLEIG